MIFTEINASNYGFNEVFYNAEFEEILSKIIVCYQLMLADNVTLSNNENQIRDVLYLNYLNNDKVRKSIGLLDYYFDRETQEDRTTGRTDLRIITPNSFMETEAYYIIECKRLDTSNPNGTTGLNGRYIEKGICRFVSQTYSAHYKTNGLIGFIVEAMDINANVASLNNLLKANFTVANTVQELIYRGITTGFNFTYCSAHRTKKDRILLYHLMLDFSKKIKT